MRYRQQQREWIGFVVIVGLVLCSSVVRAEEETDLTQGYWEGDWTLDEGGGGKQTAKVIALGNEEYLGSFTAYDGSDQQNETFHFNIRGTTEKDQVTFATTIPLGEKLGTFEWKAAIKDGKFTGRYTNNKNYTGGFTLKRVEKKLNALGVKPLPGAIVLFDGRNFDHWRRIDGGDVSWKIVDGAMRIMPASKDGKPVTAHLTCRDTFKSAQIHLEYRLPLLPEARDQERGQSGLYLQGLYELQILDSFGKPTSEEGAGAILRQHKPSENVSLPPREWQVFDITYIAPRLDTDGKIKEPGEIIVVHNDVQILDRVKVREATEGAPLKSIRDATGLVLQDAGQPVEFRNIWVVPLD